VQKVTPAVVSIQVKGESEVTENDLDRHNELLVGIGKIARHVGRSVAVWFPGVPEAIKVRLPTIYQSA
jgi:hypothetical protein